MSESKRLDSLCRRAVDYYQRGTGNRWVACLAAMRIVGTRQEGVTQSLANSLSLSVSQVENLARAGLAYTMLRPFSSALPQYRRRLTTSHFASMGDALHRYEIEPHEALEDLRTAAEEGASVASFRSYLTGNYGGTVRSWVGILDKARKQLIKLCEDSGTPDDIRTLTLDYLEEVRHVNTEG